jgi:hypothetical protein
MRLLPFVLILAACAAPRADDPTRGQEALSRDLAGREAGPPQTCISTDQSSSLTIVDDSTLSYRRGDTIWVNRLEAPCPGMRPLDTLVVELHGSQYCRNDHFRVLQAGSSIRGPTCFLGNFIPYRRR